jgi:hypothetical protein
VIFSLTSALSVVAGNIITWATISEYKVQKILLILGFFHAGALVLYLLLGKCSKFNYCVKKRTFSTTSIIKQSEDEKTTKYNDQAKSLIDDPQREFKIESFVSGFVLLGKYNNSACLSTSSSYVMY